ncbi:hypothetical protein MMC14_006513 [Varicellaria rhodocarpa]|nr:hypothetical protein [Varicellaria rhodocarpa]
MWTQFQPIVRDIYLIQGRTLNETQRILEDQYKFQASKKQLKDRVKKWGFVKNKKGGLGDSSQNSSSLEPENELDEDGQGNPRNLFNRFDYMTGYVEAAASTDAWTSSLQPRQ